MTEKTVTLNVEGMFCENCQQRIEKALKKVPGVTQARVSYQGGTAEVTFQTDITNEDALKACIQEAGYEVKEGGNSAGTTAALLILLLAFFAIFRESGLSRWLNLFPEIQSGIGYGALFAAGLLTSVHCIAMCGGINLSQSVLARRGPVLRANLLYHLGRLLSYTAIGALAGLLGQVLSPSGAARGIISIIAGILMILMSLQMLGLFRFLRRIPLHLPGRLYALLSRKDRSRSSFVIGLLNGLMPCGPLQSMQLYALSSGSAARGVLSMLVFCLGTIPLLLGFGLLSGALNKRYTRVMLTVSALLICLMGVNMLGNGLSLAGVNASVQPEQTRIASVPSENGNVQVVHAEIDYGSYPAIQVHQGQPVLFILEVPRGKLNGCNREIQISEYDLTISLQEGENFIQFTPEETGVFPYSCWMGMINSSIEVIP